MSVDLYAEVALAAAIFAGALAGCRQELAEQRSGRPEREASCHRLQRGADRGAEHGSGWRSTEPGDLPVAEPAAVRPALQGVAAAHNAGVDAGHEERADPHPQITVVAKPIQVTLVAEVGFGPAIRAERIRVLGLPAALSAGPHLLP